MQMSAMKACFQIAECSLSYAKIRTFFKRAYTWFSEDFTIIGDLFHSAIFYPHAFPLLLIPFSFFYPINLKICLSEASGRIFFRCSKII